MANSKVDICNLAQSRIGSFGSINDIDNPSSKSEKVFSRWYDVSRRNFLRQVMPNFAKVRERWPLDVNFIPAFGYDYAYRYKNNCLKILGIGNLGNVCDNYSVEGGYLLINEYYDEGLPVRYIRDVKDVSEFTDDFIDVFSWRLAQDVCLELTDNNNKFVQISQVLPQKIIEYCGIDSQENKPIIINRSRINAMRRGLVPYRRTKN